MHFAATGVWEAVERAEAMGAVRIKQFHDPIHGPAVILTDPQHAQFVLIPAPPQETRGRFPLIFR